MGGMICRACTDAIGDTITNESYLAPPANASLGQDTMLDTSSVNVP